MDNVFEEIDKTGRKIHLSKERYKHIQKHPSMNDSIEVIKFTVRNPNAIRCNEEDEKITYFIENLKIENLLKDIF